jgi:hypothetical protein
MLAAFREGESMSRLFRALVMGMLLTSTPQTALALGVQTSGVDPALTGNDADLDNFAAYFHVSREEAALRSRLQVEAGELQAAISLMSPETFGGMWIDQDGGFTLTIAFTTDGKSEMSKVSLGDLAPFSKVVRVAHPLGQLLGDAARIPARPGAYELAVKVRENRVEIRAEDPIAARSALNEMMVILPSDVVITRTEHLSAPEALMYGGLRVETVTYCTTGFSVLKATTQVRGVTTAAHCQPPMYYATSGNPWFVQQESAIGGSQDVRWMTLPGYTYPNRIRVSSDGIYRLITSRTFRSNQVVGATVCKYGAATGSTCGEIVTTMAQGCSGSNFTWVWVARKNVDLSSGGDSGGPWYWINSAWGVHSCGTGNGLLDSIYEAEDLIEIGLNVVVLTGQ